MVQISGPFYLGMRNLGVGKVLVLTTRGLKMLRRFRREAYSRNLRLESDQERTRENDRERESEICHFTIQGSHSSPPPPPPCP